MLVMTSELSSAHKVKRMYGARYDPVRWDIARSTGGMSMPTGNSSVDTALSRMPSPIFAERYWSSSSSKKGCELTNRSRMVFSKMDFGNGVKAMLNKARAENRALQRNASLPRLGSTCRISLRTRGQSTSATSEALP